MLILTLLSGLLLSSSSPVASPDQIIRHNYYDETDGTKAVSFSYFTRNEIPQLPNERILQRTPFGYTEQISSSSFKQIRSAGIKWWKVRGKWFEVQHATTTETDWNTYNFLTAKKNYNFIPTAYAQSQTRSSALIISTSTGHVWNNPMNAQASDDVRSQTGSIADTSLTQMIYATQFHFTFQSATILGVQAKWETSRGTSLGSPTIKDWVVRIVGCDTESNNKADTTNWTTTDVTRTYGGASDMWGTTCSDEQVRSNDFGTQLRAKCTNCDAINTTRGRADYVEMTVWYNLKEKPVDNSLRDTALTRAIFGLGVIAFLLIALMGSVLYLNQKK